MAERIFHFNFFCGLAAGEENLNRIGDGALVRLQVLAGVALVLLHDHFVAQRVHARVFGRGILVVVRGQSAE